MKSMTCAQIMADLQALTLDERKEKWTRLCHATYPAESFRPVTEHDVFLARHKQPAPHERNVKQVVTP